MKRLVGSLALVMALITATALGSAEVTNEAWRSDMLQFLGRFHMVVLHLPIGILLVLGLLEGAALFAKPNRFEPASLLLLLAGSASAIMTTLLGLALAVDGGYEEDLLWSHQWLGIAVAVFATIALWLKVGALRSARPATWVFSYRAIFSLCLVLLVMGSHQGGSLTHGEGFLTDYAPWIQKSEVPERSVAEMIESLNPTSPVEEAKPESAKQVSKPDPSQVARAKTNTVDHKVARALRQIPVPNGDAKRSEKKPPSERDSKSVAEKQNNKNASVVEKPIVMAAHTNRFAKVQPILSGRCYSCHGEKKAKGGLRLDTRDFALEGGFSGEPTLVPGEPEKSEFMRRILLPGEDADAMPPKGTRLTATQIQLIAEWIKAGAWYDGRQTDQLSASREDRQQLEQIAKQPEPQKVEKPQPNTPAPLASLLNKEEQELVAQLKEKGVVIRTVPFAEGGIAANFSQVREDDMGHALEAVAQLKLHLRWIDAGRSPITDDDLMLLLRMPGLTHLILDNTAITDSGMAQIAELQELRVLNLYGTKVTDPGIESLKRLKNLERVYLWQTGVTKNGAANLQSNLPNVQINMGE